MYFILESVKLTLSENSKPGYKNLTCQDDEVIHLREITYGNFPCQDASNSGICQSNMKDYFEEHCVDHKDCTLPISILYNNTCKRPPRRLKVDFECVSKYFKAQCERKFPAYSKPLHDTYIIQNIK